MKNRENLFAYIGIVIAFAVIVFAAIASIWSDVYALESKLEAMDDAIMDWAEVYYSK